MDFSGLDATTGSGPLAEDTRQEILQSAFGNPLQYVASFSRMLFIVAEQPCFCI